jgi:hypothetical protein
MRYISAGRASLLLVAQSPYACTTLVSMAISTGLWWDYSQPRTLAWTLTLRVDHGNILLSSLAFLVTLAGASFWNIFAFFLHASKVREGTVSAVGLQQQVSLRNSRSSFGMVLEALKIHRAWSPKRPPGLLGQTCSVAVPAFLVFAGFAVATIFTSSVASKAYGTVVARASEESCGFWHYNTSDGLGKAAQSAKISNDTIQARTYVASFYASGLPGSTAARSVFVKPVLPYATNPNAPCPLPNSSRCVLGPNAAYSMTTDLLDSLEMLGINAPEQDRVSLELSVTCATIRTADLVESRENENGSSYVWHLGDVVIDGHPTEDTYTYDRGLLFTDTSYKIK